MDDVGPGALVLSKIGWVEVVLVEKCPMPVNEKSRVQSFALGHLDKHIFSKSSWLPGCTGPLVA